MAGFGVPDSPVFEEWLLLRRELLHQQAVTAFHTLTWGYEEIGDYDEAYAAVTRLLALDPYREESYRRLMRLLARMGQPDQALQYLGKIRQLLRDEMDVEPSEETLALAREIASGGFSRGAEGQGSRGKHLPLSPSPLPLCHIHPTYAQSPTPAPFSDAPRNSSRSPAGCYTSAAGLWRFWASAAWARQR